MAHLMSDEELTRFREGFALWDTVGDGKIDARDLCTVLRHLGETPSAQMERLFNDPPDEERISFAEFLNITVGPPWHATATSEEDELLEALAQCDDGSGYISLHDLLRVVDDRIEEEDYDLTDDELRGMYRGTLDVSLFAGGASLADEKMWKIFEDEFDALREERNRPGVDGNAVDSGTVAAVKCESTGRQPCNTSEHDSTKPDPFVRLAVVDLSGEELMADVVARSCTVEELQQHIHKVVGVPAKFQVLFHAGRALTRKDVSLSDAGVVAGTQVMLVVKEELKVDYKKFVADFIELYVEHMS